jgi:hypothetical protein
MKRVMVLIRSLAIFALVPLFTSCAHKPLRGPDLDRVERPAFISRIEEGAGPRSEVFRKDSSYKARLKRLDSREADRRLTVKLTSAVTRFEVAERLRATTAARLQGAPPWSRTVDPARVARVLQSFLVDEVPANAPDYQRVSELGADSVVEFVIESYGMRSKGGKSGVFVLGYGRMFTLDGRELWRRSFRADGLDSGMPPLDPFRVAKEPEHFRAAITTLLDAVALQFAADLSPEDRRAVERPARGLKDGPDDVRPERSREKDAEDPFGGGLPDPDEPI